MILEIATSASSYILSEHLTSAQDRKYTILFLFLPSKTANAALAREKGQYLGPISLNPGTSHTSPHGNKCVNWQLSLWRIPNLWGHRG